MGGVSVRNLCQIKADKCKTFPRNAALDAPAFGFVCMIYYCQILCGREFGVLPLGVSVFILLGLVGQRRGNSDQRCCSWHVFSFSFLIGGVPDDAAVSTTVLVFAKS